MNLQQFADGLPAKQSQESLAPGAVILRGFASSRSALLLQLIHEVSERAPFRFMTTPSGHRMSVAMTNCGVAGWVTDRKGYRYSARDPMTGQRWPALPAALLALACEAAARAGFSAFAPDACLINRYEPGARLALHQDRNEHDLEAPIVSASLGRPAVFLFGGYRRTDRPQQVLLAHGDVAVWGGAARLRFHGVQPLKVGEHPLLGPCRMNLTLRKVR